MTPIQVCSQKERVWLRTDTCLDRHQNQLLLPGAQTGQNKRCRGDLKEPSLKQPPGYYACCLVPTPALFRLSDRTIHDLEFHVPFSWP